MLRYAETSQGLNTHPSAIAAACESILIESGRANQRNTHLATFRAIAKKYPHKEARDILTDLVNSTPGEEGKWFATAKSIALYDEAIDLANRSPCNPQTLARAARDMRDNHPAFAMQAGMTALRWMLGGYGYDLTGVDVLRALDYMLDSAARIDQQDHVIIVLREMMAKQGADDWAVDILQAALRRVETRDQQ